MTINLSKTNLLQALQLLLLAVIVGLLLWTKPWQGSSSETRKITVSGQATVKAEPDEYTFRPYLRDSGTDSEKLKASLNQQANQIVDKLKELGVEESKISVDSSSYDYWRKRNEDQEQSLSIYLNVVVEGKEMAQKVQDYLGTQDLNGQLTARGSLSEDKLKDLEKQATEEAIKDARDRAEAQAVLFDAEVGEVIQVNEFGVNGNYPITYRQGLDIATEEQSLQSSLPVLQGEDEYRKTISVVFELK